MPTALAPATARTSATAPAVVPSAVPVAVSTAVGHLLREPAEARVLACFPAAVYVHLASGAVLALVTSDGLRLPNALVVAAPSGCAPFARHEPASTARVGDGMLVVDDVRYRAVRSWTPRARTLGVLQRAAVAELGARLAAAPAPHTGEVARRLHRGAARLDGALRSGDGFPAAAHALLGLGPGLTPAGDDLLAGALVTCAHLERPLPRVAVRPGATTALSADLLAHASAGRAAPPVLALFDALVGSEPVAPALAGLLAIGSTSGHDTATGVLLAARTLLDRQEPEGQELA